VTVNSDIEAVRVAQIMNFKYRIATLLLGCSLEAPFVRRGSAAINQRSEHLTTSRVNAQLESTSET